MLVSKSDYRTYFADVFEILKVTSILRKHNEPYFNLSKFMKDSAYDHYLSIAKLEQYRQWILEEIEKIT